MAGELRVEVKSAIVFDPVLGKVYSQIESQVEKIEKLAQRIGDVLRVTTDKALPLANAFKTANDTAAESAKRWQFSLEDIGRKLADQLDRVPKLAKAYEGLGRAMEAARLPAGQSSNRQSARETVVGASQTVLDSAGSSVDQFANYEGIVKKLVRHGENDPNKWGDQKAKIEATIGKMMHGTSLSRTEAASQLWSMFDAGMTIDEASADGVLAANFRAGLQLDEGTTSGLFRTLRANGLEKKSLEKFLNTMIGQVGDFGVGNTAEALTRLLPELGKTEEDAVRLVAILQQESKNTTNPVDVMSRSRALFLEYKAAGGETAANLERYGQGEMPKPPEAGETDKPVNHINAKLSDRRQDLQWQQKAYESSRERVSVGIGVALAPIYSAWTDLMTKATNVLGVIVEKMSGVITALGAVVVGTAALVTAYAALAKGKLLLQAGKTLLEPRSSKARKVFRQKKNDKRTDRERARQAGRTFLDPTGKQGKTLSDVRKAFTERVDPATGAKTGFLGRTANAAKTLTKLLPEPLQYSTGKMIGGGLLGGVGGAMTAIDTFENAETGQEKAEGYGEAAGTVIGSVLGGFLGPLGSIAGGYIGGLAGKYVGGKINEYWGDDKEKAESAGQPAAQATETAPKPLGSAVKETAPAPAVSVAQPPAVLEPGAVVREMNNTTTAAVSLPETVASTSSTVTNNRSQQFMVTPNISINVQGVVTDPAAFARVLEPEMNKMFKGLAAGVQRDGELYDSMNQIHLMA